MSIKPNICFQLALRESGLALRHLQLDQMTLRVASVHFDPFDRKLESRTDHGLLAAVSGLSLSLDQGALPIMVVLFPQGLRAM